MTFCPRCRRTFDDGVRFCPVDGAQVSQGGGIDDRNLGRTVGNQFDILDICGRGAMGTVYRAHQRTMDRIVAVKILRRELLAEPDVVRRFVREARAAAKLQHPNIVTVHMVGETDDKLPFLVMEYVDGVSLEALCDGNQALGLGRAVRIARQIASALEDAHAGSIVHRDLKPANILIYERGTKTDRVKVLDFGIAKIVQPDGAGESILTRDGMIFGTPHYIAPEQATGSEVDYRADLYSLGVILFRMATGRLPFEGTAGMQVVLRHLREAPPSPRSFNAAIPAALETLILGCLAKDRAQRPPSAEAVQSELAWIEEALPPDADAAPAHSTAKVKPVAAASEPEGPLTSPPPSRTALRAASPRSWRKPAAVAGVAVAVIAGSALGLLLARSRPLPSPTPPNPPPVAAVAAPVAPQPLTLLEEHVLGEGGVMLRAGFAEAPRVGNSPLSVYLSGLAGAEKVQVAVAPSHGPEQLTDASRAGDHFLAPLVLGAGKQRLRVIAHAPGRTAPLVLAFDVEPPASATDKPASDRAARIEPHRARPHHDKDSDDDLPVTVVPADPIPPRAVVAAPPPVSRTPAPAMPPRATAPRPAAPAPAPPAYPTTKIVVDHPKPISPRQPQTQPPSETQPPPAPPAREEPPPAPEQPAEDPPTRPNDPTTLPPPSPDDPR